MKTRLLALSLTIVLLAPAARAGDAPAPKAETPASTPAATPAATPAPAVAPSLSDSSADQTLMQLRNLEQAAAVAQAQLNLQQLRQQLGQSGSVNGAPAGAMPSPVRVAPGEPLLVGMITGRSGQRAEFIADGALIRVREGEWISPDWKVSKLLPNGAVIAKRNGRSKTVLFGGSEDLAAR